MKNEWGMIEAGERGTGGVKDTNKRRYWNKGRDRRMGHTCKHEQARANKKDEETTESRQIETAKEEGGKDEPQGSRKQMLRINMMKNSR